MDHPPRMPAVERGEAFADLGAAADALSHQREPVERARGIALAQRRGYMRETGMKQKRLGFAERQRNRVHEAGEEGGVRLHRSGGVEQHDQAQRLRLAAAELQLDRLAAVRDAVADRRAKVEPPAAAAGALAASQPRAHAPGEAFREDERLGAILLRERADVLGGDQLVRGSSALAASASGGAVIERRVGSLRQAAPPMFGARPRFEFTRRP